jgi:uncharacterized protein YqeY
VSLSDKIRDDLKTAMKAGDKIRVSALRMVISQLKNREIEKRSSLTDDDVIAVLRSFVKRAKESMEQYSMGGRTDLYEKEKEEMKVISGYLPSILSADETRVLVRKVINETGAASKGDTGKVMKALMARAKDRLDGKLANAIVRELLEG